MLKQLSRRLGLFLTAVLMGIVTLILGFSFLNICRSADAGDFSYIQRMASLIVYQLEATPEQASKVLSDYERSMQLYSILWDSSGSVLYQNKIGISAEPDALSQSSREQSTRLTTAAGPQPLPSGQGGVESVTGPDGKSYYAVSASVASRSGDSYTLAVFYRRTPPFDLFLRQLPSYLAIWSFSFLCILLAGRFLLKRALAPTESMLQSQRDFIAAASHELKSPLAVIMAKTESLQHSVAESLQLQAGLQTIDAECSRMARLVRDLLFLASSDADRLTARKADVDVDTFLVSLYEAWEPVCLRKSIRLELNLGEEAYPALRTDRERLLQLLGIFLDNAAAYSPKGGSIEIQARLSSGKLVFFITDHGPGIAEHDQARIFSRFYRGDSSRSDKSHFGLGLSVAQELSGILGGKIGFQDTEGGGATFWLALPIR